VFGKAPAAAVVADGQLPRVALLIAAYNEAEVIEQRIVNALALDYPRDRLQIVIASDGSQDTTAEICRGYAGCVRVLDFPQRRGKAATLNAAVAQLDADIIVFSDANTSMDIESVRRLAEWFIDPRAGAVCGRLVLTDPQTGRNVDSVYWRYETFLKRCEGWLDGPLGANGAIYAIRRNLFVPLGPGTLVDDLLVPLSAKLKYGCRIVYDPRAVAFEESAPDLRGEYRRRTRIGTGALQAVGTLWPLLGPRYGWTAFTFWSHKIFRWACPLFMIASFLACLMLSGESLYRGLLLAQAIFYALCALGAVVTTTNRMARFLRVLSLFASMNVALLIGFVRWFAQSQSGIWIRTQRQ
jgi:cellulose synthase/poly-beta-1,6-N-acetylglucosamine synthase-like glycosyltransferase